MGARGGRDASDERGVARHDEYEYEYECEYEYERRSGCPVLHVGSFLVSARALVNAARREQGWAALRVRARRWRPARLATLEPGRLRPEHERRPRPLGRDRR